MFHWVKDKDFLKRMKSCCSDIVNQLVQEINRDGVMEVRAYLVGSGARNLITQNAKQPIDLDYNLEIISGNRMYIDNANRLKEYIRKKFNHVLNKNDWGDSQDSTSALTTETRVFKKGSKTGWSIDLCITKKNSTGYDRLIHRKTGFASLDSWYWNQAPSSQKLDEKVQWLKNHQLWKEVRDTYLEKKNLYLSRNDDSHSSFNIYIEAVNEVYSKFGI